MRNMTNGSHPAQLVDTSSEGKEESPQAPQPTIAQLRAAKIAEFSKEYYALTEKYKCALIGTPSLVPAPGGFVIKVDIQIKDME